MATQIGIGNSQQLDSFCAGQEAATKALAFMNNRPAHFLIVFASVHFDQEALLNSITEITKAIPVIGCSTAGEISSFGPSRRSVLVLAVRSDTLEAATGIGRALSTQPRQAGREIASSVAQAHLENPKLLLLFPDGLSGNIAEVIRGAQDILGLSFPIAGGAAGDDFQFKRTYQYFDGRVFTDSVSGILLAGQVAIGIGARHGWIPLGKSKQVTRAVGNVLMELDGQPAVNLYENYFGKKKSFLRNDEIAQITIKYPLGFSVPGAEEYLLRNATRVNSDKSLVLTGEIPEGSDVRLMMGSKRNAFDASRKAAAQARGAITPHSPRLGLVFSCISRAQLFGREWTREISEIQQMLGPEVPLAGFYDYGEQAPLAMDNSRGQSYFQNESAVIVAISGDVGESIHALKH